MSHNLKEPGLFFTEPLSQLNEIDIAYDCSEDTLRDYFLESCFFSDTQQQVINSRAKKWITYAREGNVSTSLFDDFLMTYDLSCDEGIILMCLAESFLRIPDKYTAMLLINDKLSAGEWSDYFDKNNDFLVNCATWSFLLVKKITGDPMKRILKQKTLFKKLLSRFSKPMIISSVSHAMKILGRYFVTGEKIKDAIAAGNKLAPLGYTHSFDMLGEEACTQAVADQYYQAYIDAITALSYDNKASNLFESPSVSIKLSALHPRYELAQRDLVLKELVPKVKSLVMLAKEKGVSITIDAEEAARLTLSLMIFEAIYLDADLAGWDWLGLAVQAYQKRAPVVIDFLLTLHKKANKKIPIRLVKGAYWDTEIKHAQEMGFDDYPVYTQKPMTDLSYLFCAKKILTNYLAFYPQFGTHNALTISSVLQLAGNKKIEFQCLHGMGRAIYDQIISDKDIDAYCRVYAPVGKYESLLPYLMRRLLENGANTSFVNQILNPDIAAESLLKNPIAYVRHLTTVSHPCIPKPKDIFNDRINSPGINLDNTLSYSSLQQSLTESKCSWGPTDGQQSKKTREIFCAYDTSMKISELPVFDREMATNTLKQAVAYKKKWSKTPVDKRAELLVNLAELMITNQAELIKILILEAGKTWQDAIDEIREAVDFCRYYATQAMALFQGVSLPGPTGETNQLIYQPRGVVFCISPWNFPLAIFLGQVAAALVTGNVVIAKPAEQTSLIAQYISDLMLKAGVPKQAFHLLLGKGPQVAPPLMASNDVNAVMFTGSTEVAWMLNKQLADRKGPIVPFIAETGGQNCMIVDSSALLEQVTMDVMHSAFGSAGQRCSALRVLIVQADIADELIALICGAMDVCQVGDPMYLSTDVGPVIDIESKNTIAKHVEKHKSSDARVYQAPLPDGLSAVFYPPTIIEIDDISILTKEVFGPVLHVVRYEATQLLSLIDTINNLGYGLTFGVHSRIESTASWLAESIQAGNVYVNRSMTGAVVGVQPFGGQGLSGTGPKAGGPNYLHRLVNEKTITINTTAVGGNTTLLNLEA